MGVGVGVGVGVSGIKMICLEIVQVSTFTYNTPAHVQGVDRSDIPILHIHGYD